MADQPLLTVESLYTRFKRGTDTIYAVNGVSFSVSAGEVVGVVGESGSGKSVTMMSLLGLVRGRATVDVKRATFKKWELPRLTPRQLEDIRGREIGVIFQDPMTSLNPVMRVGDQVMEAMLAHQYATPRAAFNRTLDLLREVGIPDAVQRFRNYPHEFSGGMRQRIMIAMAIACEPDLLIADEPTTALDVTVQMQILALLQELRERRHMSIVIITHDFGVATNFCDRILVMYAGRIVESAAVAEFVAQPAHPYTIGLRSSILEIGSRGRPLSPIPGLPPTVTEPPKNCSFAPRCPYAIDRCREELPELRVLSPGHEVACHRAEEVISLAG
ncbi:MAG: ABC transporter ATP-binding protein [Firmicutes bacterium]|nr:ABC transporter ATP-binding protein [Bacillota bacterium]